MNKTKSFLAEIEKIYERELTADVIDRAKMAMLDYIAVTCAGSKYLEDKLKNYLSFAEPEEGKYKAIGMDGKYNLKDAVFLNGLNGHALDYDDGTNAGIIHLGSPVFSLLIPLACRYDKSVSELLRAVVAGYETSFTLAISIQPAHKAMGYHATGTCGVLGATLAASYLLGFTPEERLNAFSAACASATGVLKVLDDGAELKPYNVAKAALMSLLALQIAKAGFKGHPDPLSGSRGFLKMMTGNEDVQLKSTLLNGTFAIQKAYVKPYAACRYLHPAIEAAIKINRESELNTEDIKDVFVRTYDLAIGGHDHTDIKGSASAKMSIPYSVAVGLLNGKAGLNEFDVINNADVLELTKKVKVVDDKEMSNEFPIKQSAEVEVILKDNRILKSSVNFPKGEPENPMSENEFEERLSELILYSGREKKIAKDIYEKVKNQSCKVSEIVDLI